MLIPERLPGLKITLLALVMFGALWISLEGDLRWSAIIAVLTIVSSSGYVIQRWFGGKTLTRAQVIGLFAAMGIAAGLIFTPLTLFFMAFKTGLHGHGPEFGRAEFGWILERAFLWPVVGLMAAVGILLLLIGVSRGEPED